VAQKQTLIVSAVAESIPKPSLKKETEVVSAESVSPSVPVQAETISPVVPSSSPSTSSTRAKSTFNLNSLLKTKEQPQVALPQIEEPVDVKPLTDVQLREAWTEYAHQRKNQVAEFHLLSRPVDVNGPVVTVALANTVEEPLLQSIMTELVSYLRNRLSNPTIKVESVLKEADGKKIAYTNKEKFDLLVEKNPMLKELKDRLGLDPDF